MSKQRTTKFGVFLILIVLMSLLVACSSEANNVAIENDEVGQETTGNEDAGSEDSGPALGTEANPLIWAFVPSVQLEEIVETTESVSQLLFEETGLVVETMVATEYMGVIEAMCSEPAKAHIASLPTFSYVLASEMGCAEVELVAERYGSTGYTGQIFVRTDSGIDELADLAGATFCRPDSLSTSGWIVPSMDLKAAGVDLENDFTLVDAGSHDAAVSGVYAGDCTAGGSYADARTRVEGDHPDVMEVVKVIHQSVLIPNEGVQYVPSLSQEIRSQISSALLDIIATEAGQEALSSAFNWDGLQSSGDDFYDPFRQLLDAAGISAADLP